MKNRKQNCVFYSKIGEWHMNIVLGPKNDHRIMPIISFGITMLMLITARYVGGDLAGIALIAFLISAGVLKFFAMFRLLKYYSGIALSLALLVVGYAAIGSILAYFIFATLTGVFKF